MKKSAAVLVAFIFSFTVLTPAKAQNVPREQFLKIATTLLYLQENYIDSLDIAKLTDTAIEAMVSSLDPHTVFLSKQDADEADETMNGEFDGVGIEFAIIKDTLTVQSVINGGPASKVGLRAGDKIFDKQSQEPAPRQTREQGECRSGQKGSV